MAYGDPTNENSVAAAFQHASSLGFQLFFSFDYAGNGPWPKSEVESLINSYSGSGAYFHYQSRPFVSTFEGPDQAEDWIDIEAATGCFCIPDWSSLGAKPAMTKAGGVADATSCKDGGTVGNTVSQLQLEFRPWNVASEAIYFTALLVSSATIEVTR
ncbi:glycosyl hydrolase family 71 [Colletotrichum orchidophilum]|uniref:Glycosyl hydrolase family 71 n=1 Tax=Colletotrichum orchidophilum TaxID=1209926 RepID=A0A1G4AUX2_9PEZI|nr:glycosyl hydrolase family 71 [Colletotrichum orchidophilum]OHE92970.1 glycosyl hydrolase family 71 [Colletotrichum orchidophilum]